jgi:glycosyltransferase involved in cell wall biosynthesis
LGYYLTCPLPCQLAAVNGETLSMVKLTIDITSVMAQPGGIGLYGVNLVRGLASLAETPSWPQDWHLELFYQPGLKNALRGRYGLPELWADAFDGNADRRPDYRLLPVPVRLSNLVIRYPWLWNAPIERVCGSPTLFHGLNYTIFPFRHSRKVITIHDLTFLKYPQYATPTVRAYATQVKQCLRWTDLVLTVSENTKQEIVDYLGFPADRVVVTPLASRLARDRPRRPGAISAPIWPRPYLLFVSTLEPRKNLTSLITAFEMLKRDLDLDLLLIGQRGWLDQPILAQISRSAYQSSIHRLRYVPDGQLVEFYRQAEAFVYPSHYEGFGLPVLEAMSLGAPVVCSDIPALRAVAGPAALFVDPADPAALAATLAGLLPDRARRDRLIQLGYAQSQFFSWAQTAQLTLDAYRGVL